MSVTLVDPRVAESPEEDDEASVTVPLNPPRLARLIVRVDVEPAFMLTVDELAVRVKSGFGAGSTVTLIVVEWERDPLVPVTVTV